MRREAKTLKRMIKERPVLVLAEMLPAEIALVVVAVEAKQNPRIMKNPRAFHIHLHLLYLTERRFLRGTFAHNYKT